MGATSISWPQVAAFRLHRHHLDRPANRNQIVDVVRDVGGVQAQLPTAAALALRTRVRGLTMDDIERALWRDRTLVKAWSMRGALHLLPASDFLIYNRGLLKRAERSMRWMARYGLSDKDADAMVASGMRDAGYRYVNIDDCIGCDQCSMACPVDCITIETIKGTPDQDLGMTSTGNKKRLHVPVFDIDIAKCCYCG